MTTNFLPARVPSVPAELAEVRATSQPNRPRPTLRRYEVSSLKADGEVVWSEHKAPALPMFEAPFTAMARGTVLSTQDGQMAIEDLMPGDWVKTTAGECAQVVWIGSTLVQPASAHPIPMARVMADSFGLTRPMSGQILSQSARILQTPAHLRHLGAGAAMMTPVRDFVDGSNVIEITPVGHIQMYNLCLSRHAAVYAGGLEIETYHPGLNTMRSLSHYMRDVFLSLFPHITHFNDFGPLAHPRAPEEEDRNDLFVA